MPRACGGEFGGKGRWCLVERRMRTTCAVVFRPFSVSAVRMLEVASARRRIPQSGFVRACRGRCSATRWHGPLPKQRSHAR